jgi:hypothetical protein
MPHPQHHTLHSLIDEVIVNPQTPEEEALENARIARMCEQIRAERDAAYDAGERIGNKTRRRNGGNVEASTFRMPRVFNVSMGRDSSSYLGGN